MFKKLFYTHNLPITTENTCNNLTELQNKISFIQKRTKEIQSDFDFILPDYIIDEIIANEETKNFLNLHYLINCAVINGKISPNNAVLIKQKYCFKH